LDFQKPRRGGFPVCAWQESDEKGRRACLAALNARMKLRWQRSGTALPFLGIPEVIERVLGRTPARDLRRWKTCLRPMRARRMAREN